MNMIERTEGRTLTLGAKRKVVTLVGRNGLVRSIKADSLKPHEIRPIHFRNADRKSTHMTDEASHYIGLGKEFTQHFTVNHERGQYADGFVTMNMVEGFFSIFKRGLRGTCQHCGEQHLQRYLTEFGFRNSNRAALGVNDAARAERAIKGATGKRLTYRRTSQ